MRYWIFQANPKSYDIVGALENLDAIMWRVPQYTDEIEVGDTVLLWRSGKDAGLVGVGTVSSRAREAAVREQELSYVINDETESLPATRVVIAVRPTTFVSKSKVAAIEAMTAHQILRAPMGTVFPLSLAEWQAIESLVEPAPPVVQPAERPGASDVVPAFAWADRRKGAFPLPGGYDAQLETLGRLLTHTNNHQPSFDDFAAWIQQEFGQSSSGSRHIALFVKRTGFVREEGGRVIPAPAGEQFLEKADGFNVLAQLHSRIQFIGEFLGALDAPKSADELLAIANQQFGMGWTTKAQIQRRRGWLQSCGAIEVADDDRFVRTPLGTRLVQGLSLQPPSEPNDEPLPAVAPVVAPVMDPTAVIENGGGTDTALELQERLRVTSTLSASPDDFEFAIRDAFRFLGFRAEKLGGSGKTDVVADADLGRDAAYRVIIDGKTTARDRVSDNQIDWDTIDDHRKLHVADYVVIAGPGFAGARTRDRATAHNAILMTADDLIELVRQHDAWPLSLDSYRKMFEGQAGEVDLEALSEEVDATERLLEVAKALTTEIENHASETGALGARDLYLLLRNQPDLEATEDELQTVAEALASPFVGLLHQVDGRFRMSGTRKTTSQRLLRTSEFFEK